MRERGFLDEILEDESMARKVAQESLIIDATEMISRAMADGGLKKVDLAQKMGHSKAQITRLLSGNRNMTIRTVADVMFVLGHKTSFNASKRNVASNGLNDELGARRIQIPNMPTAQVTVLGALAA